MFINLNCPKTGKRLKVSAAKAGKSVKCPLCSELHLVPAAQEQSPTESECEPNAPTLEGKKSSAMSAPIVSTMQKKYRGKKSWVIFAIVASILLVFLCIVAAFLTQLMREDARKNEVTIVSWTTKVPKQKPPSNEDDNENLWVSVKARVSAEAIGLGEYVAKKKVVDSSVFEPKISTLDFTLRSSEGKEFHAPSGNIHCGHFGEEVKLTKNVQFGGMAFNMVGKTMKDGTVVMFLIKEDGKERGISLQKSVDFEISFFGPKQEIEGKDLAFHYKDYPPIPLKRRKGDAIVQDPK
jgi:hypothetical protein